jgi:NitT/TauT family transport system substrate-binding protein
LAFLKGLKDTIADPSAALEFSKGYIPNFANLNADVQKQVLAAAIEMWQADRPGFSDPQAWENMQQVLLQMGLISKELDLNKAFMNQFIP